MKDVWFVCLFVGGWVGVLFLTEFGVCCSIASCCSSSSKFQTNKSQANARVSTQRVVYIFSFL